MEIKKIYFAVFVIMLIAGSFLPLFGFNENIVQASPQCKDGVDNEFVPDGAIDLAGFDPECTCEVDDDETVMGNPIYYISYDQTLGAGVDVHITSSCGVIAVDSCANYDGDMPASCLTGWVCSTTDEGSPCHVSSGPPGGYLLQAEACSAFVSSSYVCTTPYEACNCVCCVAVGNACAADSDCCSGNCDLITGNCAAAFVCATAGNACTADSDCCGGLVCNALLTCVAAPPPVCTANGSPCTTNIECCSGICDIFGGSNLCIATSGGMPICTTGGLIPCGRNCDVAGTTWLENDACTLCHLVLMGQLIIEFLVKMAAVFALLALIGGGMIYVFSIGSAGTIEKAKGMIKYALLGFVVIFIAWAVITTILTSMGYMDPLGGDWHMMDC